MYSHTQRAPLYLVLYVCAGFVLFAAWQAQGPQEMTLVLILVASVFGFIGSCFRSLTVTDEGQSLSVQFGPIPLFGTRVFYDDITAVEPGRSSVLDGWGIHWVPGRGWTYNLWGFDCVVLHKGNRIIRVGTDDRENLVRFLAERIGQREPVAGS